MNYQYFLSSRMFPLFLIIGVTCGGWHQDGCSRTPQVNTAQSSAQPRTQYTALPQSITCPHPRQRCEDRLEHVPALA